MADVMIGKTDAGARLPVNVDTRGRVVISGTVSSIGNVETILNAQTAIETVMAADVATIKSGTKTGDGNGNSITSTTVASKRGLDVNIIAGGGGGGGGGTSAQYNSTLPAYNNGDVATLQTDVNGRLITTGGLTDTQLRASAVPVSGTVNVQGGNSTAVKVDGTAAIQLGSGVVSATTQRVTLATDGPEVTNSTAIKNSVSNIPSKGAATTANSTPVNIASDQIVPVSLASVPSHAVTNAGTFAVQPSAGDLTSGNAKTQIVNGANTLAVSSDGSIAVNGNLGPALTYTATGVVSINTLAINSTDVSVYRTVSVQVSSLGSGGTIVAELSNDNSTWVIAYVQNDINSTNGIVSSFNAPSIWRLSTNGARYFRIRFSVAQTSGTTTITAYPSFQPINPTIGSTTVSNTINVLPQVSQNFGFSAFHTLISSSGTNATLVKNSTGVLGTCILTNTTAAVKYVKFFNGASAPTVGTSTPVIQFAIQANQTLDVSTAFVGMRFSTGISYAITAGSALLDTTAVAAGDILVNITYV
jgi:hypothetical protein